MVSIENVGDLSKGESFEATVNKFLETRDYKITQMNSGFSFNIGNSLEIELHNMEIGGKKHLYFKAGEKANNVLSDRFISELSKNCTNSQKEFEKIVEKIEKEFVINSLLKKVINNESKEIIPFDDYIVSKGYTGTIVISYHDFIKQNT